MSSSVSSSASAASATIAYPTAYDFNQDRDESRVAGRAAGYYYWANPQRVHLAHIAFVALGDEAPLALDEIVDIDQRLDLWSGTVLSRFRLRGADVTVATAVDPERVLDEYAEIVDETATFLASYAWREDDGWHLAPPLMPAQEIYGAEQT